MWSRRAFIASGLALAGLAACGFTPVYGPGGAGTRLQGKVRPKEPSTREEFAFNTRLAERLGPDQAAVYGLDYSLTLASTPQAATTEDNITTRFALSGTADWRLTDTASGRVLAEGQVSAFSSYGAVGTTVATVASEADARTRLAGQLADQVVTRLLATPAVQ